MRRAWIAVLLAGSVPVAAASQADRVGNASEPAAEAAAGLPSAELLVKQSSCTACHAAEGETAKRLSFDSASSLMTIASRRSRTWIQNYLESADSPHPRVVSADSALAKQEAIAMAAFLSGGVEPEFVPVEVSAADRTMGENLFKEVGCFACHDDNFAGRDLAGGWSVHGLTEALHNPSGHPVMAGRMPDMQLSSREARALAAWLLRGQKADGPEEIVPGLHYSYYEEQNFAGDGPDWDALTPVEKGTTRTVTHELGGRRERYGLVLEGMLKVETAGAYQFWTNSDDGSELFVNGERVVENLGTHPPQLRESEAVELSVGWHALRITFFEAGGGEQLKAGWSGPGIKRREFLESELAHSGSVPRPIDYGLHELDASANRRGGALVQARNCEACHQVEGQAETEFAKPFAALTAAASGCLDASPSSEVPNYRFDASQRELLVNLLRNRSDLEKPRSAHEEVFVRMNQHQCTNCHARDQVGAPSAAVLASFVGAEDLGEEGRVPPELSDVGAKLREGVLGHAIAHGQQYRPSLKARMPAFRDVDQRLSWDLTAALREVDRVAQPRIEPVFEPAEAKLGHQLSGIAGGLACIACHGSGGNPSIGVQGPQLSDMAGRLEYDWYARWMSDPTKMRPGTRMLNVFGSGKSPITAVHDGDATQQIEAIWQYLSLGDSMPLPAGLVTDRSSYELSPAELPLYFGTFYKDASARVMTVGFPERVSAAFDLHNARWVEVWRGDFMNAKGTWDGRAGQLETAGGSDVLVMPSGPSVAVGVGEGDWPAADKSTIKMIGHDRNALGQPTFRYALRASGIEVADGLTPVLAAGGSDLIRRIELRAPRPVPGTQIRLVDGAEVKRIPVAWTTGPDGAAKFVVEVRMSW
jgi:mono/diheme cytochrome c family protein